MVNMSILFESSEEPLFTAAEGQSRIAYIVCRIAQYASLTTQYENGDGRNYPEVFLGFEVSQAN